MINETYDGRCGEVTIVGPDEDGDFEIYNDAVSIFIAKEQLEQMVGDLVRELNS